MTDSPDSMPLKTLSHEATVNPKGSLDRRGALRAIAAGTLASYALSNSLKAYGSLPTANKKLLFFSKSSGFEHDVVRRKGDESAFAEKVLTDLCGKLNIDIHCSKDGRIFDKDYEQFDGYFFYTTGDLTTTGTDKHPAMSKQGKLNLLQSIANGKGFAGSHCASDTFHLGASFESQKEPDPYIQMIGGEFIRHGEQQEALMKLVSKEFPGSPPDSFSLREEWYSLKNFARDMHVILVQETNGMRNKDYERPAYPATWARKHDKGCVFYTSMGHREDVWLHPTFEKVLTGGLQWTLGIVEAQTPPNLLEVCPGADTMPPLKG